MTSGGDPIANVVFHAKVHGRDIEVGCYGSGTDWVCRLTDSAQQLGPFNDAYCPPLDFGFLWLRESESLWLASGSVDPELFPDAETVDALLYRTMIEVIGDDSQLATRIDFSTAVWTATFDGERGPYRFPEQR